MNFASQMRMIWIDAVLERGDMLRRVDLCDGFGISVPQASKDLAAYRAEHPTKMRYDLSQKGYVRQGDASAFTPETRDAVLAAQAAILAASS